MNRETLLKLYDRLTRLIEKLPGGLQKPILRELVPIREIFLEQRPPRLMLIGPSAISPIEFLTRLGALNVTLGEGDNGWRAVDTPQLGTVQVLDARFEVPHAAVETALARLEPDLIVFLQDSIESVEVAELEVAALRAGMCPSDVPIAGISFAGDAGRSRLSALLHSSRDFSQRRQAVMSWDESQKSHVAEVLCGLLPNPAKLDFARATGAKEAQAAIAGSLLKSFTAVCGVIGLQPIPLADMPVLTTLQTLMVGLIIHTTGRRIDMRLITEFLGAMGLSVGAGMLFREGARAIVKVVPIWGNAVSGLVAGAGTYAIGRSAVAYFIEDIPITETRKLFRKLLPGWKTFKRKRVPQIEEAKPPALPEE